MFTSSSSNYLLYQSYISLYDSLNKTLDHCVIFCFFHFFLPYLVVQNHDTQQSSQEFNQTATPLQSSDILKEESYDEYPVYPENFFHIMVRE